MVSQLVLNKCLNKYIPKFIPPPPWTSMILRFARSHISLQADFTLLEKFWIVSIVFSESCYRIINNFHIYQE